VTNIRIGCGKVGHKTMTHCTVIFTFCFTWACWNFRLALWVMKWRRMKWVCCAM